MIFDIIPVIDLKGGKAVRAAGGDRARYQPLISPLSPDAEPLSVARGLMALAPFPRLYIADLDAIAGNGGHAETVAAIRAAFPGLELWVDSGLATAADCGTHIHPGTRIVLGSESLTDPALPSQVDCILSLDFRQGRFLGDARLLADAQLWPQDVIVMTLDRVGAGAGPDFERLAAIIARAGTRRVYAAGGVRSAADLESLAAAGVHGALVSTALHSGASTNLARGLYQAPSIRGGSRPPPG